MLYSLSGKLIIKKPQFVVIEVNGFGFKIFISSRTLRKLPKLNNRIKLFCYAYHYQNGTELYGFLEEKEREIFELLNSISGVGPKAALKILDEMRPELLLAAISCGKTDLLIRATGVGVKKANRIILELADKIKKQKIEAHSAGVSTELSRMSSGQAEIKQMESDFELEEILKSLGYKRNEIHKAISQLPQKAKTLQEKIKFALKILTQ